jgi:hypothetical protein
MQSPIGVILWPIGVILSAIGVILWPIGVILSAIGVILWPIGVILSAIGVILWPIGVILSAIGVIQIAGWGMLAGEQSVSRAHITKRGYQQALHDFAEPGARANAIVAGWFFGSIQVFWHSGFRDLHARAAHL